MLTRLTCSQLFLPVVRATFHAPSDKEYDIFYHIRDECCDQRFSLERLDESYEDRQLDGKVIVLHFWPSGESSAVPQPSVCPHCQGLLHVRPATAAPRAPLVENAELQRETNPSTNPKPGAKAPISAKGDNISNNSRAQNNTDGSTPSGEPNVVALDSGGAQNEISAAGKPTDTRQKSRVNGHTSATGDASGRTSSLTGNAGAIQQTDQGELSPGSVQQTLATKRRGDSKIAVTVTFDVDDPFDDKIWLDTETTASSSMSIAELTNVAGGLVLNHLKLDKAAMKQCIKVEHSATYQLSVPRDLFGERSISLAGDESFSIRKVGDLVEFPHGQEDERRVLLNVTVRAQKIESDKKRKRQDSVASSNLDQNAKFAKLAQAITQPEDYVYAMLASFEDNAKSRQRQASTSQSGRSTRQGSTVAAHAPRKQTGNHNEADTEKSSDAAKAPPKKSGKRNKVATKEPSDADETNTVPTVATVPIIAGCETAVVGWYEYDRLDDAKVTDLHFSKGEAWRLGQHLVGDLAEYESAKYDAHIPLMRPYDQAQSSRDLHKLIQQRFKEGLLRDDVLPSLPPLTFNAYVPPSRTDEDADEDLTKGDVELVVRAVHHLEITAAIEKAMIGMQKFILLPPFLPVRTTADLDHDALGRLLQAELKAYDANNPDHNVGVLFKKPLKDT